MPKFLKLVKKFVQKYEAQIVIVAIILLIFNPFSRAFYKSISLLLELVPNSNIKPLHLFSKEPILKEVLYPSEDENIYADLWIPSEKGKHPAVVLDLGLSIDKSDPRVRKVASALSRSGILVLVPNIPSISQRRLTLNSPDEFKNSFKFLQTLETADQKKLGFMAFCGSSGPAFIASQDADIKDSVSFFVTIDPYFDLSRLYGEIVTKKMDGEKWIPYPKTVEIFNREAVNQLQDREDKLILLDLLVHISPKDLSDGNYKIIDPQKTFKTKEAIIMYEGLTNKNADKIDYYLSNAPEKQKEYLKKMSPSSYVKNYKPKLFILSETPSPYLPFTHAEGYTENIKGSFIEEVGFTTAEANTRVGLKDGIKSLNFIWRVYSYLNL